jgi:hypothetical protein
MPVRRRVAKAKFGPATLDELTLWTVATSDELVMEFGTLAAAREQWERRRSVIRTNGSAPEAFWIFDGPANLRRIAPSALARARTSQAVIALETALDEKRRHWLSVRGGDWTAITVTSNGHSV